MERRLEKLGELVISHAMLGFLTMLALAGIAYYLRSGPIIATVISVGALSVLCATAFFILTILAAIPFILKIRRAPYSLFLTLVETSFTFDLQYVNRLALCDVRAVQYVLTYYRYERIWFEKRGSALSGSIEKIGLFPALGAVALLSAGLSHLGFGNGWLEMLAPLILAFHFMNLAAFGMLQKMDRVIALFEYSIASRS